MAARESGLQKLAKKTESAHRNPKECSRVAKSAAAIELFHTVVFLCIVLAS